VVSWVIPFSIVIFLTEVSNDSLGGSDEIILINSVRNVGVKVILEVLEHIHVINYGVVSSNSWERECVVVHFPSVDLWYLSSDFTSDFEGIIQVLNIKVSRELIDLPSQFIVTDPKSLFTTIGIWFRFNLIDDTTITTPPITFNSDGGSHSD